MKEIFIKFAMTNPWSTAFGLAALAFGLFAIFVTPSFKTGFKHVLLIVLMAAGWWYFAEALITFVDTNAIIWYLGCAVTAYMHEAISLSDNRGKEGATSPLSELRDYLPF